MLGIEKFRQQLNLTKEYVTKVTGYKEGTMPTDEQLASLCILFSVSKEDLLRDYPQVSSDEVVIEHLKHFRNMMKPAAGGNTGIK